MRFGSRAVFLYVQKRNGTNDAFRTFVYVEVCHDLARHVCNVPTRFQHDSRLSRIVGIVASFFIDDACPPAP